MSTTRTRRNIVWLGIFVAAFAFAGHASGDAFLVKAGQPQAEIVIAEDPPRFTALAAEELQTYVRKITGADLPITSDPTDTAAVKIYVGTSAHTDKLGLTDDGLNYGAFIMKSGPDWLALLGRDDDFVPPELWSRHHPDKAAVQAAWQEAAGGDWGDPVTRMLHRHYNGHMDLWGFDERGSLNAVHEFLRGLGVRWYMAGELGEILPESADIALPAVDRTVHPAFAVRRFSPQPFFNLPREELLWRLRLGTHAGAELVSPCGGLAHEMRNLLRSPRMKREHPDYYALWGGKRMNEEQKPCLSSQGLMEEHVRLLRAVFDIHDVPMVSVMPPDGYGNACQAELCAGKATPERGYNGELSDYVWSYVDRVAREVYKTHPTKKISCFAYGAYLLPPTKIEKLSPNVVVGIVHGRRGKFRDAEARAQIDEIRRRWLELSSNQLIMWEHYPLTHRGTFMPEYFPHKIAEGLRALKGLSMGEFVEIGFGPNDVRGHGLHAPEFAHLNVYITSRLYWDPDADVDAMLGEYYRLFYGPAAAEMKSFIEYSEQNWKDLSYDIEKLARTIQLLEAAASRVEPETPYGKRMALLVTFFQPLYDLHKQLAQGREGVPDARVRWFKAGTGPELDGKLDEPFWQGLQQYRLRELKTGGREAVRSDFRVAWVGNDLVFGIRCEDPDMKGLNIQATKDEDRNIWFGDCVEILLETQSHAYYQLAISPAGALIDLDRLGGMNFQWTSGAEVAAHQAEDHWSLEVRVPVKIGDVAGDPFHDVVGRIPRKQFPWYFNVCRQRIRGDQTDLSSFAPTGKNNFHQRMKFGILWVPGKM